MIAHGFSKQLCRNRLACVSMAGPRPEIRPREDVASCVQITIDRQPTMRTFVGANRQGLLNNSAAARAGLRGSAWIDGNQRPTSFFHFVGQKIPQCAPRGIVNRLGEKRARHAGDVQILDCDMGMAVHNSAGQLVQEIRSLAGSLSVRAGKALSGFLPALRTFNSSRQGAAMPANTFRRSSRELRRRHGLASGERHNAGQPSVQSNGAIWARRDFFRLYFGVQNQKPSPAFSFQGRTFWLGYDLTVTFYADIGVHALEARARASDGEAVAHVEPSGVKARGRLETRVPGRIPTLQAPEESLKRQVSALNDKQFSARAIARKPLVPPTQIFKAGRLLKISEIVAVIAPAIAALFQHLIVQPTECPEHFRQLARLRLRRIKPKFVGAHHAA